jgi:lactoylglutathione lyase
MPRINHIALKVTDLEAATRFYENVYGFRQVKTGRSRGHISRHMTDGYVDLALTIYDSEDDTEAKMVGPGPAIHHFGIEVEDHKGFAEKVVANGGTILSKPGELPINTARPTAPSPRSSMSAVTERCGSKPPLSEGSQGLAGLSRASISFAGAKPFCAALSSSSAPFFRSFSTPSPSR